MVLSDDMLSFFEDCILAVLSVMKEQIEGAQKEGVDIDTIVLVGGFGDSPALRKYLHHELEKLNMSYGTEMELIYATQ